MNKTPDNAVMTLEDGRRATRGRGVLTIPEYEAACAPTYRACAQEIADWLDAFEQALPK